MRKVPITRRRLSAIALRNLLIPLAAFGALVEALFLGSFFSGGMSRLSMLQSQLFVILMGGLYLWRLSAISGTLPTGLFRRHGVDFEAALGDKRMEKTGGSFFLYQDRDWFVSAQTGARCAVYAPLVDFKVPITSSRIAGILPGASRGGGSNSYLVYRYTDRDGKLVDVRVESAFGHFNDWVKRHGGRVR